nr:MAG TPA: holin [Caudoviricetes sp.]
MFNNVMGGIFDTIRISLFVFILSVANDVKTFFVLIILFGVLNFLVGMLAGLKQGEQYSHRKAFHAFFEYAIAAVVIGFTAAAARLIEPAGDYTALLRLLTTLFALVYAKNIIRNFKILQPNNEFIEIIDLIINTKYLDFIKNIRNGKFHFKRVDGVNYGNGEKDKQPTGCETGGEPSETN